MLLNGLQGMFLLSGSFPAPCITHLPETDHTDVVTCEFASPHSLVLSNEPTSAHTSHHHSDPGGGARFSHHSSQY